MEDKIIKTYIDYIIFIEDPILDRYYWVENFSEDDGHTKTEAIDYANKLAMAIEDDDVGVWVEKRLITEYEDFGPDGGEGDPNPQVIWKSSNLKNVDVGKGEFDTDDYYNLPKEFISNNTEQKENEDEEPVDDEIISTSTDWHVFIKDLKSGNYELAKEFSEDWNNTKEDAIKYAQQINEKIGFATWVTQVIVTTYRDFGPDGGEGDPNPKVIWKSPELKNVKDSDLEQGDYVELWDEKYSKAFTESIKENFIEETTYMKNNKYSYNLLEAFEDLNREEPLKESRSVADIEAEIASLQQELERAKAAEKKASYNGNLPKVVYIWDIYLDPADKGSWTSADLYNGKWDGAVFETANEALDAGYSHLKELEDEGELEGDLDDYSIATVSVPVKAVHPDTLSFSNLEHLI